MVGLTFSIVLGVDFATFTATDEQQLQSLLALAYADVLGPNGHLEIVSVQAGSVVVGIYMLAQSHLATGQAAFCAVQTVTDGTSLGRTLALGNPSLYRGASIVLRSNATCAACTCGTKASSSSTSNAEIILPVVLGFFVLVLLVVVVVKLRRFRVAQKRLMRIESYRGEDKAEPAERRLRSAWGETAQDGAAKPALVPVKPILKDGTALPTYAEAENEYLPETFFGGERVLAPAASELGKGLIRHKTVNLATVPDSMTFYQAQQLGELHSKASIAVRGPIRVAPAAAPQGAFVPLVLLVPLVSKPTTSGSAVRAPPRLEPPAVLRGWQPISP